MPEVTRPGLRHHRVRVYETLRTAHLERAHEFTPASLVYVGRKYDFDESLLAGLDVHQIDSLWQLALLLLRSDVREIEINEPLMLSAVKLGLITVTAGRLSGWARRRRVTVVSYALANSDPFATSSARLRGPIRRHSYRLASRLLARQIDRLAYGSPAAELQYVGLPGRRTDTALVPALPSPCSVCDGGQLREGPRGSILFLGAFDERKGLVPLLAAWPLAAARLPESRLELLGKGALEGVAEEVASARDEVSLVVDPSRERIHQALREASTLVLLSQPSPTWREQIGLPLVEGLAHGCEIVTTTETGLAAWLLDHGHGVLSPAAPAIEVADAIVRAGSRERSSAQVLDELPPLDGRRAADDWLFRA